MALSFYTVIGIGFKPDSFLPLDAYHQQHYHKMCLHLCISFTFLRESRQSFPSLPDSCEICRFRVIPTTSSSLLDRCIQSLVDRWSYFHAMRPIVADEDLVLIVGDDAVGKLEVAWTAELVQHRAVAIKHDYTHHLHDTQQYRSDQATTQHTAKSLPHSSEFRHLITALERYLLCIVRARQLQMKTREKTPAGAAVHLLLLVLLLLLL